MTLFIRSILLLCLLQLLWLFSIAICHKEGNLLCKLYNMPHRGLGLLYYCTMKQPERADYFRDYAVQYLKYTDEDMILEGQKRPVVPMLIVREAAIRFPRNKEIQGLKFIVMARHFNRLKKEEL